MFSTLILKLTTSSDLRFPETPPNTQPGSQRATITSQDKATFFWPLTHVPRPNIHGDDLRLIQVGMLDLHQLQQLAESLSLLQDGEGFLERWGAQHPRIRWTMPPGVGASLQGWSQS